MVIGGVHQYCIASDDQRFLINIAITDPGASPIIVVLNWWRSLNK